MQQHPPIIKPSACDEEASLYIAHLRNRLEQLVVASQAMLRSKNNAEVFLNRAILESVIDEANATLCIESGRESARIHQLLLDCYGAMSIVDDIRRSSMDDLRKQEDCMASWEEFQNIWPQLERWLCDARRRPDDADPQRGGRP